MSDLDPESDQLRSMRETLKGAEQVTAVIDSNAAAIKAITDAATGPASAVRAIQEVLNSPANRALQDAIQALIAIPKIDFKLPELPTFDYTIPDQVYNVPLPLPADERTVAMLNQVHSELVGLGVLMGEGARQTSAVVEVTKANLIALQTVIAELKETRESSHRSNRVLFWLTVAIFVASFVAAIAVAPQVIRELQGLFSQLRPH